MTAPRASPWISCRENDVQNDGLVSVAGPGILSEPTAALSVGLVPLGDRGQRFARLGRCGWLRSSSRSCCVVHGKPPSRAPLASCRYEHHIEQRIDRDGSSSMGARELLKRRNTTPRIHARKQQRTVCSIRGRKAVPPSDETGIGENLYLRKSSISKYRIGTKWRRSILDVILRLTQSSSPVRRTVGWRRRRRSPDDAGTYLF